MGFLPLSALLSSRARIYGQGWHTLQHIERRGLGARRIRELQEAGDAVAYGDSIEDELEKDAESVRLFGDGPLPVLRIASGKD